MDQDQTQDLQGQLRAAAAAGTPLNLRGAGSKPFLGRAASGTPLDLAGHNGIVNYHPKELVITARAGTSLDAVAAALAEHGQALPFEPPRLGPRGHPGRDHRLRPLRPGAALRRFGAGLCPGDPGPHRPGRGPALRRRGDEERRRLRHLSPHDRGHGDPRRPAGGQPQGPARRRGGAHPGPRTGPGRGHRHHECLGRAPPADHRHLLGRGATPGAPVRGRQRRGPGRVPGRRRTRRRGRRPSGATRSASRATPSSPARPPCGGCPFPRRPRP